MIRKILIALCVFCAPATSFAFSIQNVVVLPDTPLTPQTNVQIFTAMTTPNQGAMLFMPTTVERVDNAFSIDIFLTDGMTAPATDALDETVDLGMLSAGEYSYVVRLTAGYFVNFGVREVSGTFAVVPLPGAIWLLGVALALLPGLRRFR